MDISDARKLARDLMNEHGLESWSFKFNKRKKANGTCHYMRRLIELSDPLTRIRTESGVRQTIMHEIAHGLDYVRHGYSSGHGHNWKIICYELGIPAHRCSRDKHVGTIKSKWTLTCSNVNCDVSAPYHRKPKYDTRTYGCKRCGSTGFYLTNNITEDITGGESIGNLFSLTS